MKDTYEFYFIKGELICRYNDGEHSRVFGGGKAIDILHELNKLSFSSYKVVDKSRKNSDRLFLNMNSLNTRVKISNLTKFYEYGLFDEIPRHVKKIDKAFDKYVQKANNNKKPIGSKRLVAGATALAMLAGGVSFSLNKDKAPEIANDKYAVEQEYEAPIEEEVVEKSINEEQEVAKEDKSKEETPHEEKYLFDNNLDSSTYQYVDDNYSDVIDRVARERGIDSSLLKAIVTQESSGKHPNLMQITYDVWADHIFNSYNYETGKMERIVMSNSNNYKSDIKVIPLSEMDDPYYNITIGSQIFREELARYDYNLYLGIQAYNFGIGNMNTMFNAYTNDTGKSRNSIINDTDSIEFTNYTNAVVGQGDSKYLEHVMRYVNDDEINIKKYDNGNIIDLNYKVSNGSKQKTV